MTAEEYILELEAGVAHILQDPKFNNHKNQLASWKLNAEFNRSYDESYLWNRALFLSNKGCQLLMQGGRERLSYNALKESALIYENLHETSELYDRDYALVLAAICYDLAGYQANAVCLIKKLPDYELTADEITVEADNYILKHLRQLLLKNIPYAANLIDRQLDNTLGLQFLNNALSKWYNYILTGVKEDFETDISSAYQYFLSVFDLPASHLTFLIKTRLMIFSSRSTWENLRQNQLIANNLTWTKYIKLLANDIYSGARIKPIESRLSKFEFWTSQLRAIQKGVLQSEESFVIQMPTSAGKTFIAELAILNALIKYPGGKCLYVSPFRALTNEKESELSDNLSKLGYSVSALSGNYEIDEFQDIVLSETDVLIATPEKIDLLLRLNPGYFENIALAVIDEGHILGDYTSRASLLEFLLIRLKIVKPQLQCLFISAVMPPENAGQYAQWLAASSDNVIRSLLMPDSSVNDEWEPTRKLIGSFSWVGNNGNILYKNMDTEDETTKAVTPSFIPGIIKKRQYGTIYPNGTTKAQTSAALAFRLSQAGNTLVFCAQVRDTDRVGTALINLLEAMRVAQENIPNWFDLNTDRESYFFARKWYGEDSYITRCLGYGIGVHFGDLPEAVRRSVEEDFVRGNLKVLISTNTIGQGLNFPIKNLIIHSTIITVSNGQINKVGVRDFWNIIGRAGRAGVETEGQIVFNINSPTDRRAYNDYTDKENIEPAYSLFFKVLRALVNNRITRRQYENYVKVLAEPYILNLITEEAVETDDEDVINAIIHNSLFNVQCINANISVEPLRESFRTIFTNIKNTVPTNLITVFGETGLPLESNQTIALAIDNKEDEFTEVIDADDYLGLLELIYDSFDDDPIEEIDSDKLQRIQSSYVQLLPVTKLWIAGAEIDELQTAWASLGENPDHLNILIAEGFYYRLPWAVSSFITILIFKLNIDREDLPTGITNLISYLKYGLDNSSACLLRSIGIKNRDVAQLLAELSGYLDGRALIRWTANLTPQDIDPLMISRFDRQNVLNTAQKLTPQKFESIPDGFDFFVKGISFNEDSKFLSTLLPIGSQLSYQRDITNNYDPFAIGIYFRNDQLGFVPREYAKVLSVEMDINNTQYQIIVAERNENADYDDIKVQMTKVI